jgi:hypothetical protein
MDVCFGNGQEQAPGGTPLSRFIFAMKFSRSAARKNSATERVSLRGQIFGLRMSRGEFAAASLLAFTGARAPIGFARAAEAARWESVMRYRSATVAGFHGLPCFPEVSKERQSAPVLAGVDDNFKIISYQRIRIRRYVTCQSPRLGFSLKTSP